ncbi:MAG: hypothetical protein GEU97_18325 [Actinophytocola sp.]|nr:hypothetical protein [Actinophytocola sp.]
MTNDDTTPDETSADQHEAERTTSAKDSAPAKPDERQAESREPADSIKAELDDLRDQASRRAKRSQRASRFWATTHMLLGIVAAVLALAAAGVVVSARIDDGYALAAILVAAALVLIMTFVHPDTRGANARLTARGWNALEVDLHVFLVAEYDETSVEARKDVLRSAMARTLDLMAGRYEGVEPRRG